MRRVRFHIYYSPEDRAKTKLTHVLPDTRPIKYPTLYPAWHSGTVVEFEPCAELTEGIADTWVAFAPDENTDEYIRQYWPEFDGAFDFNDYVEAITTSSRFPIDYDEYDADGVAKAPDVSCTPPEKLAHVSSIPSARDTLIKMLNEKERRK